MPLLFSPMRFSIQKEELFLVDWNGANDDEVERDDEVGDKEEPELFIE